MGHGDGMIASRHRIGSVRRCLLMLPVLLASCVSPGGGPRVSAPPMRTPAPVSPPAPAPVPAGPETLQLRGEARQGGLMRGLAPAGTRMLMLDGAPVPFDAEGNFIIAFDRDAPAAATLVATLANGETQTRTFGVAPGDWRIERVNASISAGVPSEEFQRRRAGELARIAAARARNNRSEGWRQGFIWPVKARISGVFGSQRIYRGTPGSYHSGLDLAGGAGTVYVAPADGVVTLAVDEPFTLEGRLLMIDHGMGLNSAFLHSERLLVKEGDVVRQGQPIGIIGATGRVTGPHLHWSMKWGPARIDPQPLLPTE
ncbi:peptidase M23 family protein [Sphingobium sp. SYK-6]|nr:peptidase M23 family protein [Sphingobium sp. SYK-6]